MFKVHGSKDLEMRLKVKIAFLACVKCVFIGNQKLTLCWNSLEQRKHPLVVQPGSGTQHAQLTAKVIMQLLTMFTQK